MLQVWLFNNSRLKGTFDVDVRMLLKPNNPYSSREAVFSGHTTFAAAALQFLTETLSAAPAATTPI